MPCQIKNIQSDDSTLQQLFARIETAISLSALVTAGWQFALRLTVLLIEQTLDRPPSYKKHKRRCARFSISDPHSLFIHRNISVKLQRPIDFIQPI